jgi:uncharacterized protein with HEPN domain
MRGGRIRLEDISEAIAGIEQTLTGVDLEAFSQSWLMQRAVERGLEIVSEASRGIPDELKAEFPDVPWHQISVSETYSVTSIIALSQQSSGISQRLTFRYYLVL